VTRPLPFDIEVSLYDTGAQSFSFDQDRVLVGRSDSADLRLRHAAVSRRHLTIERIVPPVGRPRFRIVPHPAKNTPYVNGVPAVEGSLAYGDVVAIGEVRLVLRKAAAPSTGARLTPMRAVIAVAGVCTLVLIGQLILGSGAGADSTALPPIKLFANLPPLGCGDAVTCAERARVSYQHGKTYARQAASLPGGWYRASLEFYRALEFQRLAGKPVPGLEDARDQLRIAANSAETLYNDLQFRLSRDLKSGDAEALRATVDALVAAVPDEHHPIRVRLDEYLRDHPLPKKEPLK